MPSTIMKMKLSLAIGFILLILGLLAVLATFKTVTAQSPDEKATFRTLHLIANKSLQNDDILELKNKLKQAEYDKFASVVIEFETTEITVDASLALTKLLLQNKNMQIIAYFKSRIESNLLIPIFAFDSIILDFNATLGPLSAKSNKEFIAEATSLFRSSDNLQKQQFAALIEKWGDESIGLYRKLGKDYVSLTISDSNKDFKVWIASDKPLILTPTEAKKLGFAILKGDESLHDIIKGKGFEITKTLNLMDAENPVQPAVSEFKSPIINHRAAIIDIVTDIDDVVADSIERRIDAAIKSDITMIIIKLDTPGGRIDSTLKICKKLEEASRKVKTVAWVSHEAISAGAMIAVTCNYIAMKETTKIGDCQPIIPTSTGYEVAGEKIQTYLRVHFRQFARAHGISEALAESMVTQELEVIEIKPRSERYQNLKFDRFMIREDFNNWIEKDKFEVIRLRVRKGELLTLSDVEAREYGFALQNVKTFQDLKTAFRIESIIELKTSGSENILRFLNSVAPIIIGLGLLGLFIEMKTPGFGLFGFLGIAIIGGFFSIKFLVGLAEYWEILLFLAGIVLLIIEIFVIPGTGIFGIFGGIFVLAGIFFAGQPFILPATDFESTFLLRNLSSLIFSLLGAMIAFYFVAKFLHKIPFVRKLILDTGTGENVLHASAVEIKRDELVGAIGIATTDLRPVGKARVGEELRDVQVKGFDYVEKGQKVIIIETSGNRIIVKRFNPDSEITQQ